MSPQELYEALTSEPVRQFFLQEKLPDPHQFLLNPPPEFQSMRAAIADQLLSRDKARKKLPTWFANPAILWPPPLSLEQASSEITARYKADLMQGKKLVDLTGGTGVDCLTIGQNYDHIHYVEQNEWLSRIFSHNSQILDPIAGKYSVHRAFAEDSLDLIDESTDVFIDPARRDTGKNKVFKIEDCTPDLTSLLPELRKRARQVMIKLSPMLDLTEGIRQLSPYEVHIVSVANECKELLFQLNASHFDNPKIVCYNYQDGKWSQFEYQFSEEGEATSEFRSLDSFIYEPNASIMKAGAFQLISLRLKLKKLGIHTHLYTSSEAVSSFPGRIFQVIQPDLSGKELKKEYIGADLHVISRNHPMKADEIRKKYKLVERDDLYLIAYTDWKNQKKMSLTKLIRNDQFAG